MRFKVLIVPFLVIMILILGIGYIKPDLEAIQMKKADIVAKDALVANIDTILANINSLGGSLDTEQELEKFAYRYLPDTLNQDQAIDAFNFLAAQSGLVIAEMALKQPPEIVREEALLDPSANVFVSGANMTAGSATSAIDPPPAVKIFILTGSVTGSYENIKVFFDRLAHTERFQKVRLFSIKINEQAASPEGVADTTAPLRGTFEAEYGYLPPKPVVSALNMPVFLRSKFDFSNASKAVERITSPVPILEKGQTGKPNPFQ